MRQVGIQPEILVEVTGTTWPNVSSRSSPLLGSRSSRYQWCPQHDHHNQTRHDPEPPNASVEYALKPTHVEKLRPAPSAAAQTPGLVDQISDFSLSKWSGILDHGPVDPSSGSCGSRIGTPMVGIFLDDASILCLVEAVLAEQHKE